MGTLSILGRRRMLQWGLMSAGASMLSKMLGADAWAQNLGPGNRQVGQTGGRDEAQLFQGKDLPGGAQTEIRLNQSIHTDDPDELEVALRMKPFNPQSWYEEWRRVALRNEEMAEEYAAQGLKASAHEFYMRAFQFHRLSIVYQQDTDPTMLPGYRKMREMFDKAWQMDAPPFERVTINVDGHQLAGFFRKPGGPAGTRFPAAIVYQGADSLAESTILGAGGLVDRGLAALVVDLPGQGAAKRLQNLYMLPDTERYVKDLVNYLETRPDVDSARIGLQGVSMGSYSAPRAASGESRIKAVWVSAGSHDLLRDLFEYFPPIQDRVRWIVGARDLAEARRKLRDYTVENAARNIRCPMLIGYSPTDRIMDPQGAFRLYQAAVNSERQMWTGGGHGHHDAKSGGPLQLRLPTDDDWAARRLGALG